MKKLIVIMIIPVFIFACTLTNASAAYVAATPRADPPRVAVPDPVRAGLPMTPPSSTASTCTITATVLNLRRCPNVSCGVMDWLDHDSRLIVLSVFNAWFQVTTPAGQTGWVNSNYCDLQKGEIR
jgi:uncharacterized protein YgiM (DUF1202 family)